jgi:hypothetical protein
LTDDLWFGKGGAGADGSGRSKGVEPNFGVGLNFNFDGRPRGPEDEIRKKEKEV